MADDVENTRKNMYVILLHDFCFEIVFKLNEIWKCIYLIFAHLTCVVLQPHKFHYHYSNLQYKKLREMNSLVVTEENTRVSH